MTATAGAPTAAPLTVRRARAWARENLFGSIGNTALTVFTSLFVGFALYGILQFVFFSAEWEVITTNRRLFFVGRFPAGDDWRLWISLLALSGLAGLSWGLWSGIGTRLGSVMALGIALVFAFVFAADAALLSDVALLAAGSVGVFLFSFAAGKALLAPTRYREPARNVALGGWVVAFVIASYLISGVSTSLWGGLLLTMALSIVGIAASFPLALLLAIGRASTFPIIRLFCIAYIELIRGVPLITILFMAKFIIPLTVGRETSASLFGVDVLTVPAVEMDDVVRAMAAITIFSSAYLAEIVRGGLQAVPRGQVEAAQALGLGTMRILAFIVLPQALRAVIPAIVGQFIALFKDTSLVIIVGLTDLLGVARQVTAQPDFIGRQAEALLFVALIYWIVAFSMSRASQRLERNLGVGER